MGTPAANIDEAIDFADNNIAEVAYGAAGTPTESLLTQFDLWIAGMFATTGIFVPSANETSPLQRAVTNWYPQHVLARAEIEGPAVGDASIMGVAAVINAVSRVLWAVKYATINSKITAAQQTAVVNLYNTVWA